MIARAPPRPRLSTAGPPVAGHGIGEDKPLDGGYLSGLPCSAGLRIEWCCLVTRELILPAIHHLLIGYPSICFKCSRLAFFLNVNY